MKSIHFMAGLPRSGTTLLTSILNQNPEIYTSPLSPLLNTMGLTYNQYQDNSAKDVDQKQGIYNMLDQLPQSMYRHLPQRHIIDKNFHWTDDIPFTMIYQHIGPEVKVICPVRNILEILSSFNTLAVNDRTNSKDRDVASFDKTKLPMADRRANFWMNNPNGEIRPSLEGMKKALYPELRNNFHFIEYTDLVERPKETIEGVYQFLEIVPFEHDFGSLKMPFEFNDSYGLKNHHKIRPTISNEGVPPEDVFLPETIEKYSGLEFWRNLP